MSVFQKLGTIFGQFRSKRDPPKLNHFFEHYFETPVPTAHFFWECVCTWAAHFFSGCTWAAHFFPVCTWAAHFFPGCTWAAHFFLVCKNCSGGLFPSRRFALVSLVKKVYLIAELSFSCLLATAVKKLLVAKYKFVGNIQAEATSPRSLNSVLKLRGNRDVEVESNRLVLERKYLWLTGSSSRSTTAAYTASKKNKNLEFTKAFGHYCEKSCWFTIRRNAK